MAIQPSPHAQKRGFTLIELLIVVAIVGIIAAVIFVALNPLKRFQDSRDAVRWSDARQIMEAIQVNQVDDGGAYITSIDSMTADRWYMITDGNGGVDMQIGCDHNNAACDIDVHDDGYCVDLDDLVTEGYLGDIPVSPPGTTTWDHGDTAGDEGTGYALYKDTTGALTVQACDSEGSDAIRVVQ